MPVNFFFKYFLVQEKKILKIKILEKRKKGETERKKNQESLHEKENWE